MGRISRAGLLWGFFGVVVLVTVIVWTTRAQAAHDRAAGAQPAPAASPRRAAIAPVSRGVIAGTASASTSSRMLPYPVPCCSAGNPLGLTLTGQAVVRGAGTAARVAAVTKAVSDAADQAKAVAGQAGASLGRIINVQVSASYYPYPLPVGATAGTAVSTGCAPGPAGVPGVPSVNGASGYATPCPAAARCPAYPGASTTATVTVTWAIA